MANTDTINFLDQDGLLRYHKLIKEYIKQQINKITAEPLDVALDEDSTNAVRNQAIAIEINKIKKDIVDLGNKIPHSGGGGGIVSINLEDGVGNGSVQQVAFSVIDEKGDEYKWNTVELIAQAYGPNSVALNRAKTYQMSSFATGSSKAGKTEEEFNDYFWDSVNNTALHGGKGKNSQGYILDKNNQTYKTSYSFAVALGESCKAIGRGSHASGYITEAIGEYSFAHGKGAVANLDNEIALGQWNEINTDSTLLISIGNGADPRYNGTRKTTLKIYKSGAVESFVGPVSGSDNITNYRFVRARDVSGQSLRWSWETDNKKWALNVKPVLTTEAINRTNKTHAITASSMNAIVRAVLSDPTTGEGGGNWTDTEKTNARTTIGAAAQSDVTNLLKLINGLTDAQIQALNTFAQSLTVEG